MASRRGPEGGEVLEYGEPQVAVAIVFGVLALTIAGIALVIAVHAKADVPYEEVSREGYRLRRPWLDERRIAWLFVCTGITLFCAMGLAGLAMRLNQAEVIDLPDSWFYRLLTLHGAGMLAGALLVSTGAAHLARPRRSRAAPVHRLPVRGGHRRCHGRAC